MKVLFTAAELTPIARVGGLAEAAAGLVRALRAAGVTVQVVLPDYGDTELGSQVTSDLDVPAWAGPATTRRGRHDVVGEVELVSVPGMERSHPYVDEAGVGWPDNPDRFFAFSAAVAAIADRDQPDVVHLNDWHTAFAAGLLDRRHHTVLTIHTIGYQGVADARWLDHLGARAAHFAWWDDMNPLAGALQLVDRVITVSPNYATEIVTADGGMGLDEILRDLGPRLVGIRNGIDTGTWDPATDPHIAANYAIDRLEDRLPNRTALVHEVGWSDDRTPIVAMVSRLVEQKGIDLVLRAARFLAEYPARLVVLGAGESALSTGLRDLAQREPERAWFFDGYDERLAHRLFAGSDLFLMPSRFEPCGLAQMQAMAYGSIPVVTDVGGLHDTVIDADRSRRAGTGFVSRSVDDAGVVDALHRGVRASRHAARRSAIRRRGMDQDWSWTQPAARHSDLYQEVAGASD